MKIEDITLRQIFDSRGEPTIEVSVVNDRGEVSSASVPSGKSRGTNEVEVFTFAQAHAALETSIKKILTKKSFSSVAVLDQTMQIADGTPRKEKWGGNVMLGISVAFARALAQERNQPLWKLLEDAYFEPHENPKAPYIFSNLINGGAHANNNLDIQEYMVVVEPQKGVLSAVQTLIDFYRVLGDVLRKQNKTQNLPIGDEGGYAVDFKDNLEPLKILESLIEKRELTHKFSLALDVAASSFYEKGEYAFGGKKYSASAMAKLYAEYTKKISLLVSIEDPCNETDFEGFQHVFEALPGKWIVGDDLTTTNPDAIRKYATEKMINAVIIKPNQIGTVSEACDAIQMARLNGVKCIISHRSGETEDTFIIHLARAAAAEGVKIGAPAKERMIKFNELIRIYE